MSDKSKKARDLALIFLIYLIAYAAGYFICTPVKGEILRYFLFDIAATVITFIFSVIFRNSSIYDPYWSLTPMIMAIYLFISKSAFSVWQILFLAVFCLWAIRLTANWITVTSGFSYEDWRYRKYRNENTPFLFFFINLFGIHLVPTLVVFGGMLPLFEISENRMGPMCLPGICIIIFGIFLEFLADREMHEHLNAENAGKVCRRGLWKFSRHPNYLGEISVWAGTFITMLPFAPDKWYYVIGTAAVILLFNAVSIPLMEKRQITRRPEYAEYKKETSRLLLLPEKSSK